MKNNIHPEQKKVVFKCAGCKAEFSLLSCTKNDTISIDICSRCHPVYIGASIGQQARGRAEEFANKFNKGREALNKKTDIETKNKKTKSDKKIINDLSKL